VAAAQDPRGFTYSEQHRHQCEVRYVLRLPSRMARWAYVEGATAPDGKPIRGVRHLRGDAAADRLRDAVRDAWRAQRATTPPAPSAGEAAPAAALRSGVALNAAIDPVSGSSLGVEHAGDSDPVQGVVSGVPAR